MVLKNVRVYERKTDSQVLGATKSCYRGEFITVLCQTDVKLGQVINLQVIAD